MKTPGHFVAFHENLSADFMHLTNRQDFGQTGHRKQDGMKHPEMQKKKKKKKKNENVKKKKLEVNKNLGCWKKKQQQQQQSHFKGGSHGRIARTTSQRETLLARRDQKVWRQTCVVREGQLSTVTLPPFCVMLWLGWCFKHFFEIMQSSTKSTFWKVCLQNLGCNAVLFGVKDNIRPCGGSRKGGARGTHLKSFSEVKRFFLLGFVKYQQRSPLDVRENLPFCLSVKKHRQGRLKPLVRFPPRIAMSWLSLWMGYYPRFFLDMVAQPPNGSKVWLKRVQLHWMRSKTNCPLLGTFSKEKKTKKHHSEKETHLDVRRFWALLRGLRNEYNQSRYSCMAWNTNQDGNLSQSLFGLSAFVGVRMQNNPGHHGFQKCALPRGLLAWEGREYFWMKNGCWALRVQVTTLGSDLSAQGNPGFARGASTRVFSCRWSWSCCFWDWPSPWPFWPWPAGNRSGQMMRSKTWMISSRTVCSDRSFYDFKFPPTPPPKERERETWCFVQGGGERERERERDGVIPRASLKSYGSAKSYKSWNCPRSKVYGKIQTTFWNVVPQSLMMKHHFAALLLLCLQLLTQG